MSRLAIVIQGLGLLLTAGCTAPSAAPNTEPSCNARAMLRIHATTAATDDAMLRQIAEMQRLGIDSVMQLGDHLYRVSLRSDREDCATLIARLNRDERVKYAVLDERKRPH